MEFTTVRSLGLDLNPIKYIIVLKQWVLFLTGILSLDLSVPFGIARTHPSVIRHTVCALQVRITVIFGRLEERPVDGRQ